MTNESHTHGVEAFPLHWPASWPRTKYPERSRFKVTPGRARDELFHELERLGARNVVLSTNVTLRNDGIPYATQRRFDDMGVAAYFTLDGKQQCIPCDRWDSIQDNMRAIAKTVDALRGIERWGAKQMVDAAFQGFEALGDGSKPARHWRDVLQVSAPNPSREYIAQQYRTAAKVLHPDKGIGSTEDFQELQAAYEQALAEVAA